MMTEEQIEYILESGTCFEISRQSCTGCPLWKKVLSQSCIFLQSKTEMWVCTDYAIREFKKEYAILKIRNLIGDSI